MRRNARKSAAFKRNVLQHIVGMKRPARCGPNH
jgi:hypothetical protein